MWGMNIRSASDVELSFLRMNTVIIRKPWQKKKDMTIDGKKSRKSNPGNERPVK